MIKIKTVVLKVIFLHVWFFSFCHRRSVCLEYAAECQKGLINLFAEIA